MVEPGAIYALTSSERDSVIRPANPIVLTSNELWHFEILNTWIILKIQLKHI